MDNFIPVGPYEDIINQLGQWKILDMKSLSNLIGHDLKYHNLLHKVRKLEGHGLVKSTLMGRKDKHIYLTDKGLQYTSFDNTFEISEESLGHDLIVGKILRTLNQNPFFFNGRMFHQIAGDRVLPDAEIRFTQGNQEYSMAIEVELTQKEQGRVKEKFRRYGNGKTFDYVLFLTNKETLLKAYQKYLEQMSTEIQEGVILSMDGNLNSKRFNLENLECHYMGKTRKFLDMLKT